MSKKSSTIRFPLAGKLIAMITIIVLVSMLLVTGLASFFYSRDVSRRSEENNYTLVEVFASRVDADLRATYAAAYALVDSLRIGPPDSFAMLVTQNYFSRNAHVAYVGVPAKQDLYNKHFFEASELDVSLVRRYIADKAEDLAKSDGGAVVVLNASPYFAMPMIGLAVPYSDYGIKSHILVLFSTEHLQALSESGSAFIHYAVSHSGDLLVYPDLDRVKANSIDVNAAPLSVILASEKQSQQFRYTENGSSWIAAFQKTNFGNVIVCSVAPLDLVYEAVYAAARQTGILTGIVLLFSILAVWFFSHSISRPVLVLKRAAERIEEGDFDIALTPTTRDELGQLTVSFANMSKGLAERERIKETFGKFVNKEIAERAASGDLKLGGERKTATIFFSDIRSFTAISERMSPEKVVEFLNEYMTRMVDCIEKTNGVVDKFIGDAIMGVWGAPVSSGSPAKDAQHALQAMLMMRASLHEFNKNRGGPDEPVLHIGCGLNTGPCLAGQIGSTKRMEYTVIGDAVNLASRIEALNKPFGTDILISGDTYELVKDFVITEAMPPIKVKGKTDPLQIYAVINFRDAEGPMTLDEVRAFVGIDAPRKLAAPDSDEVKYEILKK